MFLRIANYVALTMSALAFVDKSMRGSCVHFENLKYMTGLLFVICAIFLELIRVKLVQKLAALYHPTAFVLPRKFRQTCAEATVVAVSQKFSPRHLITMSLCYNNTVIFDVVLIESNDVNGIIGIM